MKQFVSALTLFFFAVTMVAAQVNTATTAKATAKSGAYMTFETETIDYGTIEHNADGVRIFKFTNTGTEPLIITNAQGSCGCTVPAYTNKPILPGESGEIKVKYATDRLGKFNKRVTVTSNAANEQVVLTIKGDVLKKDEPTSVPSGQKSIINQ